MPDIVSQMTTENDMDHDAAFTEDAITAEEAAASIIDLKEAVGG